MLASGGVGNAFEKMPSGISSPSYISIYGAQRLRSNVRTSKHFWMSGQIVPYRERGEPAASDEFFFFVLFGMPVRDLFRWPPITVKAGFPNPFFLSFKKDPYKGRRYGIFYLNQKDVRSGPPIDSFKSHRRPWSYTIE